MAKRKNKLLLVYPNQQWVKVDENTNWNLDPRTLCVMGAVVKHLVDVVVIDAQFEKLSVEAFTALVRNHQPKYVGISVLSSEYGAMLRLTAKIVKDLDPSTVVVAGGVHSTSEKGAILEDSNIDYSCNGEGEFVLRSLLEYLEAGATDDSLFPKEGLVYRRGSEVVVQERAIVEDLNELPWPDYDLIDLEKYLNTGTRFGPLSPPKYPYMRLIVTRGCPFGCSFCQVEILSGKTTRFRDPDDIVDEILHYKEKYGIQSLVFDDDNIIGNKRFFKRLLELMIEKKLELPFIFGAFAVFLLTDEILALMVEAGCKGVNISVESGSQRVIDEIVHKPIKLDKIPAMIRKIQDAGLFCIANFILGYPGEKWNEILDTVNFAERCNADYVKFFVAVPLKGTRLWDMAQEMDAFAGDPSGINVEWRFSQIKSDEWTSKDVSILRAYEWDRVNFSTPEKRKRMTELWRMSEDELFKIRKRTRDNITFRS